MSPSNAENNEDFKEDENSKWSTDIENDAAVEHRHPHDDRHRDFANSKISPASVKEKWRAQTKQSLQDLGVEGDVLESGRRRNSFHQRGMTPRERFGIDSPTTTKNLNEIDSASMPPGQRGPQILRQKRIQTQQTGFDIIQNNFENALTANGPSMTIQGGRLDCGKYPNLRTSSI